jgi:RimJ/RimL family protein N-acetyltransferase
MIKAHPELFTYVVFPVIDSDEDFMREVYNDLSASPKDCLYAIVDKGPQSASSLAGGDAGTGTFAGIISLNGTNPVNAVTEIGVVIFPAFQRTYVATNATGLLLLWTLDPPSRGGLGLRRVEWKANAANVASRRTALRMGFEFEGVARWERVFPRGEGVAALSAEGLRVRNGTTPEELPGRHTAVYSIVWDEWDEKRPVVLGQMERKV